MGRFILQYVSFCVPDHTLHNGQSILLVSEPSEYACLKAYRQGSFYGALRGSGLGFEQISLDGINLHVRVNARAKISIIRLIKQNYLCLSQNTRGAF